MSVSTTSATPVAVVTGSSSGIGRATALALGRAGYAIVLHARRNIVGLQQVAQELRSTGLENAPQTLCLTGDIACPQTCNDLVRAVFAWQGRVDAWINNAGADVLTGRARRQSFEARLQRLLAVDVQGTVRLSRLVASRMASQPPIPTEKCKSDGGASGHIINMGWDQATLGMEGEPGQLFGTTKAAVAAFSSSLALTYPNIRVNCIAPGWIRTEWGQTAAAEYWAQRAEDESLQARWGLPEDVAQLMVWLVSDASRFINGQTIAVNGGRRYYPRG